ncbi:MAG: acetate/propionate family kinase [Roseibium sp.]|uniref:acetate/propionate family kinase n=1 Tax=Roseibium sp. TaxID=1936156 RepID=UPI00260C8F52|nr:acetate/propionate family kinase [Roseibium sp.]MCV0424198.1 acetate/propionate family kinase [Roseibium sp.]
MGDILVLNSGSSSIKFAVFAADLSKKTYGSAVEIGGASKLIVDTHGVGLSLPSHVSALDAIFGALEEMGIALSSLRAAAHRVVHGGRNLLAPCLVNEDVLAEIDRCIPLAPLHNPHNLAAIRAVAEIAPELAQCVSFDTAFHATNPEVARRYAIPDSETEAGLQRYGFHGISYQSLVHKLPGVSGKDVPERLLALHLGNGASLCAVRRGKSVATTMGYSPLEGLTMGTRCGSIDGNVVLKMVAEHGVERTSDILNKESGLLALGGFSDMRQLQSLNTEESRFAVEHFCYWAIRHAGSMIAAMGGLDAVAFTGGIGENDARARSTILEGLSWLGVDVDEQANEAGSAKLHAADSRVEVWIVPAEEEEMIARNALSLTEPC